MQNQSLVPNTPTVKPTAWWLAIPLLMLSSLSADADDCLLGAEDKSLAINLPGGAMLAPEPDAAAR